MERKCGYRVPRILKRASLQSSRMIVIAGTMTKVWIQVECLENVGSAKVRDF
jgi:hypothetical protein